MSQEEAKKNNSEEEEEELERGNQEVIEETVMNEKKIFTRLYTKKEFIGKGGFANCFRVIDQKTK